MGNTRKGTSKAGKSAPRSSGKGIKKKKGLSGNAVNYISRNQALTRLQVNLAEFRRLCILKGVHPREPRKKTQGAHKTYYHAKDVDFLQHEKLLGAFRAQRAHDKKVVKARGKQAEDLARRLASRRPGYTLDHLVRERYPTFVDALRDLDDPLTLSHLFASLPADKEKAIPLAQVQGARRLCLEFQAWVARTHSLRKVFVSVKGIYYQAAVLGQAVTWIVPHALSQLLPEDVDYRVMLTFLEFYLTLLAFANFKLYHTLGLSYPPLLDSTREEAMPAAALAAIVADLASAAPAAAAAAESESATVAGVAARASSARLATLGPKLAAIAAAEDAVAEGRPPKPMPKPKRGARGPPAAAAAAAPAKKGLLDQGDEEDNGGDVPMADSAGVGGGDDDDAGRCAATFRGLAFHLAREVPRESLLFVVRAFGGRVAWDDDAAAAPGPRPGATHAVVDRPSPESGRVPGVTYVTPQWVYDCANARLLLPAGPYAPGLVPPPHLSPFVDHAEEGYTPEYAETIARLQAAARGAASDGGAAATVETRAVAGDDDGAEGAEGAEGAYQAELAAELAGIPYSRAGHGLESGLESDIESEIESEIDGEAMEEGAGGKVSAKAARPAAKKGAKTGERDTARAAAAAEASSDAKALKTAMMSRKTRGLYEAMQMGNAKKRAAVEALATKRTRAAAADAAPPAAAKAGKRAKKAK